MGYLMSPKMRQTTYIPACEDQKREYFEARKRYRTKGARAWLWCCFCIRTVLMLLECYRVAGLDRLGRVLAVLIPSRVKEWWTIR